MGDYIIVARALPPGRPRRESLKLLALFAQAIPRSLALRLDAERGWSRLSRSRRERVGREDWVIEDHGFGLTAQEADLQLIPEGIRVCIGFATVEPVEPAAALPHDVPADHGPERGTPNRAPRSPRSFSGPLHQRAEQLLRTGPRNKGRRPGCLGGVFQGVYGILAASCQGEGILDQDHQADLGLGRLQPTPRYAAEIAMALHVPKTTPGTLVIDAPHQPLGHSSFSHGVRLSPPTAYERSRIPASVPRM